MATKKANTTEKKRNPFKSQVENLETFKFTEETPDYLGVYVKTNTLKNQEGKPFKLNVFADPVTGEQVQLGDNYSIERAISEARDEYPNTDIVFKIHFLGKTVVKGKPFSRFRIETCPLSDYMDYIKE